MNIRHLNQIRQKTPPHLFRPPIRLLHFAELPLPTPHITYQETPGYLAQRVICPVNELSPLTTKR